MAPITLYSRQSTSSTSDNCPSTLSGGDIAGIVLGTIAGTLLILWLIHICLLPGAFSSNDSEVVYATSAASSRPHRHRRSYRTAGPDYVDYVEKSPVRRSSSGRTRRSGTTSVSRPERVYIAS